MSDLDALLAGIVANPQETLRWLIVADWLDDHDQPDRAELLRLHREMIRTCCEPDVHPERAAWQARIVELIDQGVKPCVPQRTLMLPGGVPLVGNFIPPGSFLMSTDGGAADVTPVERVMIEQGFFMGISPVTQRQWKALMGKRESRFRGGSLPEAGLAGAEVVAFCERASVKVGLTVRLPTDAEWEYACRAGTTTHFHYGDVPDGERMNCDGRYPWNEALEGKNRQESTKVGSFPASPWGLFDCHGNVWEMCGDKADLVGQLRILRGGSWYEGMRQCRAASRLLPQYDDDGDDYGFRVAFTLS